SQDGSGSPLDPSQVDEGGEVCEGIELFRTSLHESVRIFELQGQHVARTYDYARHARVRIVCVCEAVDPGVPVPSVELREPEHACKHLVERRPVHDLACRNAHDWHNTSELMPRVQFVAAS